MITRKSCKFVLIFLILIGLISCNNDNPVSQRHDYSFDSSRYKWEIDTIHGEYFVDGWYCDTNKIFFIGGVGMIKYDGVGYTHHYFPASFYPYSITGFDEHNVYIGGTHTWPNGDYRAMLKKWTGGSFSEYSLTDSADNADNFFTVYYKNQNELWLSATKGKVYKFDGNNFQTFRFDTNYWYIAPFMKDESGSIYFTGKIYYGKTHVDSTLIELQKYTNSSWDKVYTNMRHNNEIVFYTQNLGNEIIGVGDQVLYKFNGSNFNTIQNINEFLLLDYAVCGASLNNFSCKGYDYISRTDCLFNWNGTGWSKELTFLDSYYTKIIFSDINRIYVLSYSYPSNKTYILKGKKK